MSQEIELMISRMNMSVAAALRASGSDQAIQSGSGGPGGPGGSGSRIAGLIATPAPETEIGPARRGTPLWPVCLPVSGVV